MPAAMTPAQRRLTEVFYLGFVLWREARSESRLGKTALVYSILNRVQRPSWWGRNVVEVCIKPWQYSSMTDPHDKQLTKYPGTDDAWPECLDVAMQVYDGLVPNPVPMADSYYAISMDAVGHPPDWADPVYFKKKTGKELKYIGQIGNHKFFDTDGEHPDNVNPITVA